MTSTYYLTSSLSDHLTSLLSYHAEGEEADDP